VILTMARDMERQLAAAIRAHCLQCSGGMRKLVDECPVKGCNLYPYRRGGAEGRKNARAEGIQGQMDALELLKEA